MLNRRELLGSLALSPLTTITKPAETKSGWFISKTYIEEKVEFENLGYQVFKAKLKHTPVTIPQNGRDVCLYLNLLDGPLRLEPNSASPGWFDYWEWKAKHINWSIVQFKKVDDIFEMNRTIEYVGNVLENIRSATIQPQTGELIIQIKNNLQIIGKVSIFYASEHELSDEELKLIKEYTDCQIYHKNHA